MFIYFAELFISVFVWEPVLVQACVFLYCASVDLNGGLHGSRRQSDNHATFMYFRAGQRCCSAQLHKHWVTVLAFLPAASQKYICLLPSAGGWKDMKLVSEPLIGNIGASESGRGAGGRILFFLFLDWKTSPPSSPFHSHSNLWHFRPPHFFFFTGAEFIREAVLFW